MQRRLTLPIVQFLHIDVYKRQAGDFGVRAYAIQTELVEYLLRGLTLTAAVVYTPEVGKLALAADPDVVRHSEGGNKADLLMDHGNALQQGIVRR